MLIKHTLTGESLQLNPDQSLTIVQSAGWTADEDLPGAYSYEFDFPLTPANNRFLQYGYRADAVKPVMELPVRVELEGVLYRNCTLAYRIADGQGNGYLKIDSGEVYDKLKELSLRDAFTDVVNLGGSGQALDQRMNEICKLPPGAFPLTFFPIRNELFFEEDMASVLTYTRQPYVNAYAKLGFQIDKGTTHGYPVSPQFYLAWLVNRIFEKVGYRVSGDWIGSPEVQRLVVFNQTAMLTTPSLFNTIRGFNVTVGMHLPDISVGDFLKAIRQRFGLIFAFNANSKTASIRRFVDVVRNSPRPTNLTPFQLANWGIDDAEQKGFTINDYVDPADELYKDPVTGESIKPAPFIVGKGGTPIDLKCGTTQLIYTTSPLGGSSARWLVPTVRMPGNILDPYYKLSDRALDQQGNRKYSVGLRLLSYRGMTVDSAGNAYPLATPDIRDGKQAIVGTESCALAGPKGVFATSLRAYFYFRDKTRPATMEALLPVATLSTLKLDEFVQARLGDSNLTSFLPNKIQATAPGASGLVFSKLEILTLPAGLELSPDVANPLVWVELIQTREEIRITGANATNRLLAYGTKLEVKIWADRNRTTPAVANAIQINIRRATTTKDIYNASTYAESIVSYPVSGTYALLEQRLVEFIDPNALGKPTVVAIKNWLDPGEGYNII